MVLHDPQEFGGLEEYAVSLAIGLQDLHHDVSVFSTTWVPTENQYVKRLRQNGVTYIQVPKWPSRIASHWPTKIKLLDAVMVLAIPTVFVLSIGLFSARRKSWKQSFLSATGWLRRQLLVRFIAPDRYKPLARIVLFWWRLRWHPDLLHIHGYTDNLLFAIEWAYENKLPVVYEEHQTPDSQFDWWKDFSHSINKAAVVVAVSDKSAEGLRLVCGVTRPIIVRNPLLPDPFVGGWQRNDVSRVNGHDLRVTTIARLTEAKGLNYLLKVVVQVRSSYPLIQFRVYGDGDLRKELLNLSSQLGLNGDEIFVGPYTTREELSQIMAETDIFLMSSVLEGQPLAVVEAMAYACPIVTTAVGGIPELIQDGVNGILCEPRDPICLAKNIIKLIEDPQLRFRLGGEARKSYEKGSYQRESVSKHFVSIYNQAVQEVVLS
jgi:glycosyltransferase involved in cell wall biosynthesis